MYISMSDRHGGKEKTADAPVDAADRNGVQFRLSPVILWLGLVSLATDISSESAAAVLPLYVTGFLGLSVIAFGIIDGINQGASALVRIAAGWVSDRLGRPKHVALAGYGLSMLARIGFLFAGGFWSLAAAVTGDRIGKGIRTAPRDALITTAAQPEHLARHFGVHRMLDNIGAATGPVIAFLVLMLIPNGYGTVFVISLAFAAIGVAALALAVPNLRTGKASWAVVTPLRASVPVRWQLFREPGLGRLLITSALLGVLTVGDGFIYLVLQARDSFAVYWFPLLYVGTNVVFLLLAIPLGRLADRYGRGKIFVAGHLALVACYLFAAAPFGGTWPTLLCLALLGAFYAATDGVLAALAAQLTPADRLATGIGTVQTVTALSRVAASTAFGVLWFATGPATAMMVVAVLLLAGIPAAFMILRKAQRRVSPA
ncbi:MFS transporter [Arthrobacter nitrophenolicus]|uniref:MFS transporter n=1 Tax=Arthrobacter nitrophenolicus TaxID=683150 RepID=A0A4R5YCA9_9MICC|nr:MFS transporter [Arthrobacter nitrophenolicus]TDL41737.1 MFS transporter [Arthrobacter nitrophenolicus]